MVGRRNPVARAAPIRKGEPGPIRPPRSPREARSRTWTSTTNDFADSQTRLGFTRYGRCSTAATGTARRRTATKRSSAAAQPLGDVEAPDAKAAEAAAAGQFGLSHEQRQRLVVRVEDDAE